MNSIRFIVACAVCFALQGCVTENSSGPTPSQNDAAVANMNLGAGYLRQGNTTLAIDRLQRALVQDPRLVEAHTTIALAVSLHAPNDELRDRLVPINRMHPIAELLDACWQYAECLASRQITFEYVLLDGVNDSVAHARDLVRLLKGRPAKVNLIPFNPFPESEFRCSKPRAIDAFWKTVRDSGIITTVRRTRGDDIAAACGQRAGRVRDRRRVRLSDKVSGATPT